MTMTMPATPTLPPLLALPSELRNHIYGYIFTPDPGNQPTSHTTTPSTATKTRSPLSTLLTSRQIHTEAHLLALHHTTFHLSTTTTSPPCFARLASRLTHPQLTALRHLHVHARTADLRALNEQWRGLPFGHPDLRLSTLTITPARADASASFYAEVADLSQSHTLAYILAETLKRLRGVGCVEVRNEGCFGLLVWRVVYRSLVHRLWRWGGAWCGVRFECAGEGEGDVEGGWFRVWLAEGGEEGPVGARECGEEVMRLLGDKGGELLGGRSPDGL